MTERPAIGVAPSGPAKHQTGGLEFFLRFLAIVAGIVLGILFALHVGFSTGWIQFC